jgi:hypothetical protein
MEYDMIVMQAFHDFDTPEIFVPISDEVKSFYLAH